MRFFSVAAVFLAGAASVFANDVEKRDNTVVSTVHVTSTTTVSTDIQLQTQQQVVIEYHTVSEKGYKHSSVSMPPLKPFTKKRKPKTTKTPKAKPSHTTKAHKHTPKAKNARDVIEIVHTTVQDIKTIHSVDHQTKVHTEKVHSTVHATHTKTVKDHRHPKITGTLPPLFPIKKHRKTTSTPSPTKAKRSFGAGWFA